MIPLSDSKVGGSRGGRVVAVVEGRGDGGRSRGAARGLVVVEGFPGMLVVSAVVGPVVDTVPVEPEGSIAPVP